MTKILIIEDERVVLENMREILEFEGFETACAENGLEGVRVARAVRPDLIICDIMMPGLDGFEVLKELRRDSDTATIPFIFLTALETRDDVRRGMSLGADDYISKPVSLFELMEAIRAQLEKQRVSAQVRLRALSRRLVEVQEAERRHITRELHGEIYQLLAGAQMTLGLSKRLPPDQVRPKLDESLALVNEVMRRVSEMSLDLHPPLLDDLGLLPALLQLFNRFTNRTQVRVAFRHAGLERRFVPEVEIAAYRIVQEALANVARHTSETQASVQLSVEGDVLSVVVEDEGEGFDLEAVLSSGSAAGLTGMHERAGALGGELTIFSAPGSGTRVVARLPAGDAGLPADRVPIAQVTGILAPQARPSVPGAKDTSAPVVGASIRVLVADKHDLIREGLRSVLDAEAGIEVVGEARNFKEAVEQARKLVPDVVALDRSIGLDVVGAMSRYVPELRVLALSHYANEAYAIEALRIGAHGYLWKEANIDELVRAVRSVAEGHRYLSEELSERVLDYVTGVQGAEDSGFDPLSNLTNREREVFHGVVEGLRNADIAKRLSISPRTVETHRANMMRKLGVRNQADLVRFALQHGLISIDGPAE